MPGRDIVEVLTKCRVQHFWRGDARFVAGGAWGWPFRSNASPACHRKRRRIRYLAESDFRYNDRSALGINDKMRAAKAVKGVVGRRLTYHRPDEAAYAYAKGDSFLRWRKHFRRILTRKK